jgi:serine/threonine protein phosphatase PrpC
MLSDAEIHHIVTTFESLDTAANTLVQRANDAGGVDNITALLARVEPA